MGAILTALWTYLAASALYTLVGGRVYFGASEEGAAYPQIIFSNIATPCQDTFTEHYENFTLQFSVYSQKNSGITTISAISDSLCTLFADTATFNITGYKLVRVKVTSSPFMTTDEEALCSDGSRGVHVWIHDVELSVSLN